MATLGYIKDGVKGKVDLMPSSYPASRVKLSDGTYVECDKTTAGTYVLKATVDSNGNVTYQWVSAT